MNTMQTKRFSHKSSDLVMKHGSRYLLAKRSLVPVPLLRPVEQISEGERIKPQVIHFDTISGSP